MKIVIYEQMLNLLAQAIEDQRPELLGAHTVGFHKTIPPPWNANEPGDPIVLKALNAVLDYDARGSGASFKLLNGQLVLTLTLNVTIRKSVPTTKPVSDQFTQTASLVSHLADATGAKPATQTYPLIVDEAQFTELTPPGIRDLLSWIIANAISSSLDGLGVPLQIPLLGGAQADNLVLHLAKPKIATGSMNIDAIL